MLYPFSIKVKNAVENVIISVIHLPEFVPNVTKNITAKVFDLMSWKDKTKQINWHESCKCVCVCVD